MLPIRALLSCNLTVRLAGYLLVKAPRLPVRQLCSSALARTPKSETTPAAASAWSAAQAWSSSSAASWSAAISSHRMLATITCLGVQQSSELRGLVCLPQLFWNL